MFNEILFIMAVLIDVTFILFSLRFGKTGIIITATVNLILVSTFASKLLVLFGFVTNVGNIFYGSLFLATNLLVEHYGKKEGFRAIWIAFTANMLFVIMGQFTIRFLGDAQSFAVNDAISILFANTPRIALASILAYIVVQNFNVWLFDFLKQKTKGEYLWLRHGLSTTVSQLFDSLLFFTIAFYLVIPTHLLIEAMVIGFLIKTAIGLLSTPLLYLGNAIKLIPEETENVN